MGGGAINISLLRSNNPGRCCGASSDRLLRSEFRSLLRSEFRSLLRSEFRSPAAERVQIATNDTGDVYARSALREERNVFSTRSSIKLAPLGATCIRSNTDLPVTQ